MTLMHQLAGTVRAAFNRAYRSTQDAYYRWWGTYRTADIDDIPAAPEPGLLYLVGEDGRYWIAAMRCPCGCGETLEMNLLPDAEPVWTLTLDRGARPTLAPSVWPREACGAHFILRSGKIRWC